MWISRFAVASVFLISLLTEAQQTSTLDQSSANAKSMAIAKNNLKFEWVGDENHKIIGVEAYRAVLIEEGKYVLVEAVMARNGLKMRVNDGAVNLVNLPPIKENTPRTFHVKINHKAKVERLDFEFENIINADKYYLALQITDENFVPTVSPGEPPPPPIPLELPLPPPVNRGGGNDPDSIYRSSILNSKSAWSIDLGYGNSIIKGTDVQTQKTATLASDGDMRVALDWETTLMKKVRTHFAYSISTIKRLAPAGWGLESSAGMLDRPQMYADFAIWKNLNVFPGMSFGEFEWIKVSNANIVVKKTRQFSLDFGIKFLPLSWASFQWGLIFQGQSLLFTDGGSNLDMGIQIQGLASWSKLSIALLNSKSSLLIENTKNSTTQSTVQFRYLF